MTDFRIPLPDTLDGLAKRELDWDREAGIWTLSEQEYGASHWDMGMPPNAWDLGQILVFFRMIDPVEENNLVRMTPGECIFAHTSQISTKDIVGDLCPQCGDHWLVYRYEEADQWHLYGRTCSFTWHRGRKVTPDEDPVLAALLSGVK